MRETAVTFVLEQHLGHRTYSESLKAAVNSDQGISPSWVDIQYATSGPISRLRLLPEPVRAAMSGRAEVKRGLRLSADVRVFNTQVPAVLGGNRARSRPYLVVTDVTPVQYDRMAAGYGHRPDAAGPVSWLKHRANRRVFREASWCVGWSRWAASSIVRDYGVDSSRVAVIPPGVDLARWRRPGSREADRFRILFVGGDFHRKGGHLLVEAFKDLSDRAELYLVTKSTVPRADRVHVIGDLAPNDPRLIDLYAMSDVFVLPTIAETFGIAAVEASAMGLPVVSTSIGGLPDIVIDRQTGIVVDVDDVRSLTAALQHLERDQEFRLRLGDQARAHAESNFDAHRNACRLFDLVRDAAGQS